MSRNTDLMNNCPVCDEHDWIDYGDYIECGVCGHIYDDDEEPED